MTDLNLINLKDKFELRNETYGIILILSNNYLHIKKNFEELKKEIEKDEKTKVVWIKPLFGAHDLAILLKTRGNIDNAISVFDKWAIKCLDAQVNSAVSLPFNCFDFDSEKAMQIKIDESIRKYDTANCNEEDKKFKIYLDILMRWIKLTGCDEQNEGKETKEGSLHLCSINKKFKKKFEIFDCRMDALIPIFFDEKAIEQNATPFLIIYLRFNKKEKYSLEGIYSAFDDNENLKSVRENIVGVFNGFGIFDIVIVAKGENYQQIGGIITKVRSGWVFKGKNILSNSLSLITFPEDLQKEHLKNKEERLHFSTMLKTTVDSDNEEIWKNMGELGKRIGLRNIHIENGTNPYEDKIPLIWLSQGLVDIHIVYTAKISEMKRFIDIIVTFPFVVDISTVILYDIKNLSTKI